MAHPPTTLALDLATEFGWALGGGGRNAYESGWKRLPDTGPNLGRFLLPYKTWLVRHIAYHQVELVVVEEPIMPKRGFTNLQVRMKLDNLIGTTELICQEEQIPCRQATISKWRAHFLGKGYGSSGFSKGKQKIDFKRLAVERCRLLGMPVTNHNEAEAIGILDYILAQLRAATLAGAGPLFTHQATPGPSAA